MSEIKLPINKLSYSSFVQLLRNPIIFKMKYILGVYETKMSVSGVVGKACHKALKFYYGGDDNIPCPSDIVEARGMAREIGLAYVTTYNDNYIEYGKTGNKESMLKTYTRAMDFYFAEEPEYNEIIMCEKKMEAVIKTYDGDTLPLPAVGVPDLVHRTKDGDVEIIDTKFVKNFTDYQTEDYVKIIQAQFLDHLLFASEGIKAKRAIFREIKTSENKEGGPQLRDWVVPLDHEPYRIIFYNLYKDVVKFLSNDPIFLPNLSDTFDGEQAGLIYAQGLINADMSDVEVMHKVRDVAFTSKKFISSRVESDVNKNLLPEEKIKMRLAEFGIPVEPVETKVGASITQYRFKVSAGVRMNSLKKYKDDIARALEAKGSVNIVAPIQGTSLVGIEVENEKKEAVKIAKDHFVAGTLSLPIGIDVHGNSHLHDLRDMPHLLIAGATGSGKSYMINNIITALTNQLPAKHLKLVLIDPKRVELKPFANKPHVLGKKVHYDKKDSLTALANIVNEMEARYKNFEDIGVRDIKEFNEKSTEKLEYIVTIVDEFADLMMQKDDKKSVNYSSKSKAWLYKELTKRASKSMRIKIHDENDNDRNVRVAEFGAYDKSDIIDLLESNDLTDPTMGLDVEMLICRIAQMGRAAGIHLVIATQRPSVDVISGLIKANFPTRIALTVSSATDSIVILGVNGAESLTGKGDLLFMTPSKPIQRLQGFSI